MITNIGQLLKNERKKRGLSIKDVEKQTRIRSKNLKAIEDEVWDQFPSRTYIQGIIKTYGRYLGLEETKLIAYFRREYEKREQLKFKKKTTKNQFKPHTKRILTFSVGIIFLIFAIYFGYQLHLYFSPPDVIILEPQATTFKKEDKITLKGQTERDTIVTINEDRVFLDDENVFSIEIPLVEDENKVIIEATGANGRTTTLERTFSKIK